METDRLIKRFLEETNYDNDKNIILMMAYGSRITNNNKTNSDLDILIVTSGTQNYKGSRIIDGIIIDINISSIDYVQREILISKMVGSAYLESVLKTGKIIIDKYDTYDQLCNLLDNRINKKRNLNQELLEEAVDHIEKFMLNNVDRNVHYFTALEFLRRLYHAKNNCSNINLPKVYDLYTDKNLARDKYKIKLPNNQFILEYLNALNEVDIKKQREILIKLLQVFSNEKLVSSNSNQVLNKSQIKSKLATLNNDVIKCEDMLIHNHPYANALYYIVISEIIYLYEKIYKEASDDLYKYYYIAVNAADIETKIRSLENLFCFLDSEYRFDYNDYMIRT